ncbi:hypothetical protein V8D89_009896 [Ganoderma adspersum]
MQLKITKHLIAQGVFGSYLLELCCFESTDQLISLTLLILQGKVFEGQLVEKHDQPGTVVAVKICHVTNKVRHPLLLHEACALSILRGHRNIPEVFAWGRSQFFEYIALQRLGPTLEEAFWGDKREPLSLRNMVILVCQMIDAVQHVHSKGIVHRDIKPDNFILGLPGTESAGRLYLIDFGLCKPYRHPETGEHLPCKRTRRRVACRTFSTVYDNYHETLSRRDDMIALAYTMMALLTGTLPWEWIHKDDLPDDRDGRYTEDELEGYPDVFGDFYNYALHLEYETTPDYDPWKARFREAMTSLPEDPLYDPADTSEPLVGVSLLTTEDTESPGDQETTVGWLGIFNGDSPIPGGDDGWVPAGEFWWDEPYTVKADEVLGDELKIVEESHIHFLDNIPMSDNMLLAPGCPLERMQSLETARKAIDGEM